MERVDTHKRKVSEFVEKLCVTQELNEAQAKWEKTKEKSKRGRDEGRKYVTILSQKAAI